MGEATSGFDVSKPVITKHLEVLEEAGVVVRSVEGRTHRLTIDHAPLGEVADWLDRQRALWERMFDAVDEFLEEQRRSHDPAEPDRLRLERSFEHRPRPSSTRGPARR